VSNEPRDATRGVGHSVGQDRRISISTWRVAGRLAVRRRGSTGRSISAVWRISTSMPQRSLGESMALSRVIWAAAFPERLGPHRSSADWRLIVRGGWIGAVGIAGKWVGRRLRGRMCHQSRHPPRSWVSTPLHVRSESAEMQCQRSCRTILLGPTDHQVALQSPIEDRLPTIDRVPRSGGRGVTSLDRSAYPAPQERTTVERVRRSASLRTMRMCERL